MKDFNRLEELYYRERPREEVKDSQKSLGVGIGTLATGIALGPVLQRLSKNKAPVSLGKHMMDGIGFASMFGFPYWATQESLRRKKILEEMGIDTTVLKTPIDSFKKYP